MVNDGVIKIVILFYCKKCPSERIKCIKPSFPLLGRAVSKTKINSFFKTDFTKENFKSLEMLRPRNYASEESLQRHVTELPLPYNGNVTTYRNWSQRMQI